MPSKETCSICKRHILKYEYQSNYKYCYQCMIKKSWKTTSISKKVKMQSGEPLTALCKEYKTDVYKLAQVVDERKLIVPFLINPCYL